MSKLINLLVVVFIFSILFPSQASSHGVGQSFSKDVGEYRIEFEYDVPEIVEGEVNSFVFRILNKDTAVPIPYDSALVRFEKKEDSSTFLVTRLAQDELQEGLSRLTSVLDKGDYLISLNFKKDETKIAETTYDLTVVDDKKGLPTVVVYMLNFLGGLLIGVIAYRFLSRKRKDE